MQIPVLSSTPEETKHHSPESSLIEFLDASPQSIYRFTAPRDAPGAEICREGRGGEDCRTMGMTGKEMFAMMQKLGFFCALPMDPTKTYMECSPSAIPKS